MDEQIDGWKETKILKTKIRARFGRSDERWVRIIEFGKRALNSWHENRTFERENMNDGEKVEGKFEKKFLHQNRRVQNLVFFSFWSFFGRFLFSFLFFFLSSFLRFISLPFYLFPLSLLLHPVKACNYSYILVTKEIFLLAFSKQKMKKRKKK